MERRRFYFILGLLITGLLFVTFGQAFAQSSASWVLVYETDDDGDCNPSYCDIADLTDAIDEGAEVRVVTNDTAGQHLARLMVSLSYDENVSPVKVWGSYMIVYTPSVSQGSDDLIFMKEQYVSDGRHYRTYTGAASRPDDEYDGDIPTKWYVRY